MKLKRSSGFIFAMCVVVLLYTFAPVYALTDETRAESGFVPNVEISAKAVYLYNIDTDTVIYSKNANQPMPPAAMTKLMTAILALEMTDNLDSEEVTYPLSAQNYLWEYQQEHGRVANAGLMAGDTFSMRDALYALMLPSANDVAISMAEHLSGSQESFVTQMNNRARELGALNTNFANSSGLSHSQNLSTAYDIAQLAMHAIKLPGFTEIATTPSWNATLKNRNISLTWTSTNRMQSSSSSYYYPNSQGIIGGYVPGGGFCMVSTASKDGFTYLLVVMGCGEYVDNEINLNREMQFVDSARIYNWVFDSFRIKSLMEKGKTVHGVPIKLSSQQDQVKLMAGDRFTSLLPSDIELSDVTLVPYTLDEFTAPVKKNDPAGEMVLLLSGEEIGRVPLVFAESVEASAMLIILARIQSITRSFWFKFSLTLFVLLVILYTIFMMRHNRKNRHNTYRRRRRL